MARINLLPWRAERRKQREKAFYATLFMAFLAGALVVGVVWYQYDALIADQSARNQRLQNEIAAMDRRIAEIAQLEEVRERLTNRQRVIEQLQASRSQMVHLFDELVRTIPEGVRLNNIKQTGDVLTIDGVAQSNARVSAYMRSFEQSQWLGNPELRITQAARGAPRSARYNFTLRVTLKRPGSEHEQGEG